MQEEFQIRMRDTSMAVDTPRDRILGVRPGTAGKSWKDSAQLSTHKHTKRVGDRVAKQTEDELLLLELPNQKSTKKHPCSYSTAD